MPELTRDAVFEALRQRRHYGTTGTRIFIDLHATFEQRGHAASPRTRSFGARMKLPLKRPRARRRMGDIIRPGQVPMRLAAEVIGTAPIERVEVLHGTRVVADACGPTPPPISAARVRVLWQGAEYRGRGRETMWQGKLTRHRQPHRAVRAGQLPQSRAQGRGGRAGHARWPGAR